MATYAQPIAERRVAYRRAMPQVSAAPRLLVPLGRALFAAIFIVAALPHFTAAYIGLAAQAGVPMANILVPFSGILALLGGLSILLGFHARLGAWLLVMFLVPVTLAMHNFWTVTDPATRAMQQGMFMKNVAMLGVALLIAYFGAGPVSLDAKRRSAVTI